MYSPGYDMFIAGVRARGRVRITLPLPLYTEIVLYKRQALKGGDVQPPGFGVVTFHVAYSSLLETGGRIERVQSRQRRVIASFNEAVVLPNKGAEGDMP